MELVLSKPSCVDRVGKVAPTFTNRDGSEREERVTFCHFVAIDDDFLDIRADWLSAVNRVLLAFFGAHVVGEVTFTVWDAEVGLLDAADQLIVETVALFCQMGCNAVCV